MDYLVARAFKVVDRVRGNALGYGRTYLTALVSVHEKEFTKPLSWFLYRSVPGQNLVRIQHFTDILEARRNLTHGGDNAPWVLYNNWLPEALDETDPLVCNKTFYRKVPATFFGGVTKLLEHKPSPRPTGVGMPKAEARLLEALAERMDEAVKKLSREPPDWHVVSADPQSFSILEEPDTRIWLFHAVGAQVDPATGAWLRGYATEFVVYLEYAMQSSLCAEAKILYGLKRGLHKEVKKILVEGLRSFGQKHKVKVIHCGLEYVLQNARR